MQFEYWFYTAWCKNQGGGIVVPMSDENYHELMDVVGSLINPEIHEKCMHSTGDVIIWLGEWIQPMLSKLSSIFSCWQATRMKRWRTCGPLPSLRMIQSPLKV